MVFAAALRAFPSIFHGAALRLLVKTLLLTLLAFALLAAALWTGIHAARLHFGWATGAGWGGLAEATATAIAVIAVARTRKPGDVLARFLLNDVDDVVHIIDRKSTRLNSSH